MAMGQYVYIDSIARIAEVIGVDPTKMLKDVHEDNLRHHWYPVNSSTDRPWPTAFLQQ